MGVRDDMLVLVVGVRRSPAKFFAQACGHVLISSVVASAATVGSWGGAGPLFLDRWARHRPVRTIDAAIARLGLQAHPTAFAVVDILAGISRHRLESLVTAVRTGDRRLQLDHGFIAFDTAHRAWLFDRGYLGASAVSTMEVSAALMPKALVVEHLAEIRDKLGELKKLERVLVGMAKACDANQFPACPSLKSRRGPFERPSSGGTFPEKGHVLLASLRRLKPSEIKSHRSVEQKR